MNKKLIALVLAAVLVVACFALAACGGKTETTDPSDTASSDLAYIKDKGTLVIGITDFEPMDFQKEGSDEWKFAESLGVKAEFQLIEWDYKTTELDGKTIDCVWNGMTLTEEVKAAMDCSKAYLNNQQIVIVPADKAADYQTAEACKDLQFAVENGSAGEEVATEFGFKITEVENQASALQEVAAGTCDAAIIDSLMAGAMVGEGTSYANLTYTVGLNNEEYGVGFRKGSDVVEVFNAFLDAAIADGTVDAIAETYDVQAALIK